MPNDSWIGPTLIRDWLPQISERMVDLEQAYFQRHHFHLTQAQIHRLAYGMAQVVTGYLHELLQGRYQPGMDLPNGPIGEEVPTSLEDLDTPGEFASRMSLLGMASLTTEQNQTPLKFDGAELDAELDRYQEVVLGLAPQELVSHPTLGILEGSFRVLRNIEEGQGGTAGRSGERRSGEPVLGVVKGGRRDATVPQDGIRLVVSQSQTNGNGNKPVPTGTAIERMQWRWFRANSGDGNQGVFLTLVEEAEATADAARLGQGGLFLEAGGATLYDLPLEGLGVPGDGPSQTDFFLRALQLDPRLIVPGQIGSTILARMRVMEQDNPFPSTLAELSLVSDWIQTLPASLGLDREAILNHVALDRAETVRLEDLRPLPLVVREACNRGIQSAPDLRVEDMISSFKWSIRGWEEYRSMESRNREIKFLR